MKTTRPAPGADFPGNEPSPIQVLPVNMSGLQVLTTTTVGSTAGFILISLSGSPSHDEQA